MPLPKGQPKPDYVATRAQLMGYLRKSVWANKSKEKRIAIYKKTIEKLRNEVGAQRAVFSKRFTDSHEKYYWCISCLQPTQEFIKVKKLTSLQFQLLMLCKYHSYVIKKDMQEWMMVNNRKILVSCVKKDILQQVRVGKSNRLMYFPTEKGKQIINEYCTMIDEYTELLLTLKLDIDDEKAAYRKSERDRKKICRVSGGVS